MSHTVVPALSFSSTNTVSLADAALTYAHMGLAILPLVPRGKEPLVKHGYHDATTDLGQIRAWWSQWHHANIGIAMGEANGWVVLDVDPRHRGLTSLEAMERHARDYGMHEAISATLTQVTGGGGLHLVYQWPGWEANKEPSLAAFTRTYPGIELKKKGYIVAAPSRHPHGWAYRWLRETPPASFPTLLEVFLEHSQPIDSHEDIPGAVSPASTEEDCERDPAYWLRVSVRKGVPGRRHNYAMFLAIQLVEVVGCSFAEAVYWMRAYAALVLSPPPHPYDPADALECLDYAWRRRYGSEAFP